MPDPVKKDPNLVKACKNREIMKEMVNDMLFNTFISPKRYILHIIFGMFFFIPFLASLMGARGRIDIKRVDARGRTVIHVDAHCRAFRRIVARIADAPKNSKQLEMACAIFRSKLDKRVYYYYSIFSNISQPYFQNLS